MAFRTLICRALPLATRAVASPRTYHGKNISSVQNRYLRRGRSPRIEASFVRFYTKSSSDENLLEIIESEIGCADKPDDKRSEALQQFAPQIFILGKHMASIAITDICDAYTPLLSTGEIRVLQPIFNIYGQRRVFSGPIVTLKVFEDNVLVRDLLETKGEGRVLVIDGGGSRRCALVGGNIGVLAQNNGWAGIVVNGCIRDVDEINSCDIGVRALGPNPVKSVKKGIGEKHIQIDIAGTSIRDGEWLYADSDGILISKNEVLLSSKL